MAKSADQSESDSFWEDAMGENLEVSTTVVIAVGVLIAFSVEFVGFEWAVIAMLGLIAGASATE